MKRHIYSVSSLVSKVDSSRESMLQHKKRIFIYVVLPVASSWASGAHSFSGAVLLKRDLSWGSILLNVSAKLLLPLIQAAKDFFGRESDLDLDTFLG
jgi:hypothetical protein